MPRKPNGASSIYQGSDGSWHGRVTIGIRDDGKPDRRHVRGKTEATVTRKVRALERDRDNGNVRKPGENWTVAKWLTHWLENIATPNVRENTAAGYRVAVNVHLIPGIGAHRLEKLTAEHIEKLTRKMQANGSAAATAHQAHRTLRTALNEAMRRGHITKNPASLAKPPRLDDTEVEPYTVEEVQRILIAVGERRNGARWALALALGLRQGEALGLKWSDVDLENGTLIVRRSRLRPRWQHGCSKPCGRKMGGHCPDRRPLRDEAADTKSRAGRRRIGLPDQVVSLLQQHKRVQDAERTKAAQLWTEDGWVFTTPTGGPLNPRTDYTEWKRLLKAAGLRDARLHDARHTAATVLLVLKVAERAVMGIMGWSDSGMTKRYQHLTGQVRRDVAERVGGLLWQPPAADRTEPDDGAAGVLVPAN
ncbi:tyrosine-type recombinase/integrase [Phytohabitans houttuyneae]|uniref:Site-specific integrase n=1 Tax=Phytohabitans houttuyneae TaxID=1076126 RepID=A0A6V8K4G3_9ACTN|nr:tyrosine-type recombinase/integrase [Phytohabitans houttuyneae]GFJ80073.1 site-specific integrase [Phytohabitans houttuyneae]